ncbi:cysteine desulfurase NifS [Methanospirillum sp. J.3.6.1-F.2.7.3]|uniref:Cysteine desulfurase IscS n=1 Tax=Methanospirillum purgamenti TaxID=2834276 RepID=A0A8E7AYL7_9EURY|nr:MULTISPECIES: cysteine desulfurase NifS [Methanospirillum]MDX8549015.1 cysteine desulfurase NifS [Methanospirillum hungatei]QVV88699.1 cysteine desulfurase NifS [Methanospirillum sp. J.3.6.1-F.2.7.3]
MASQKTIYMDHSATTATDPAVVEAMLPWYSINYGNPSSLYRLARESRTAIEEAREKVAKAIGAKQDEIFFTSGGTESDNWALKGAALALRKKGNHIITSAIEHHAITHTCDYLKKQGFEITYLPVDEFGQVRVDDLKSAITDKTILVSVMFANNEIGTIQPIPEIGAACRERGILFHTDAVQVIGNLPINVESMNIDLLSLSAHKFYGPKGIGALYIRKGVRIDNYLHGGGQEHRKRAGTENVPGIVGLGVAIEKAVSNLEVKTLQIRTLRDALLDRILHEIPNTRLNGHRTMRLPGNINVSFDFIEGESLLLLLDHSGIAASTGSACSSGSLEPSHVLLAIGLPAEVAHGSLRLTLGLENTNEDISYAFDEIKKAVERLRAMSPLYADYLKKRPCNV